MTDNDMIKYLRTKGLGNGACLGHHSGTMDLIADRFIDLLAENNRQNATIEKCVNACVKKEDTTQLIAQERNQYFDELQMAKAEIENLKERLSHTVGIDNTKQNGCFPFD